MPAFDLSRTTCFCALALLIALALPAVAQTPQPKKDEFQTSAPYAILIDADSGTVLFEKNADKLNPPASMSKLMTVEVVLHTIERGQAQARRRDDHQRERLAQGRRAVGRLGDVRGAQQPRQRATICCTA